MRISYPLSLLLSLSVAVGACNPAKRDPQPAPSPSKAQEKEPQQAEVLQALLASQPLLKPETGLNAQFLSPTSPEERQAIRERFEDFRQAVLHYNGSKATQMLSESSLRYYHYVLYFAKLAKYQSAHYAKLKNKLSTAYQTLISLVLQRLSDEQLNQFEAQDLYTLAFNEGWIAYKSFQTASIDKIEHYQDNLNHFVLAEFLYEGALNDEGSLHLAFWQDRGQWYIDLVPIFTGINLAVDKFVREQQLDPESLRRQALLDSVAMQSKAKQDFIPPDRRFKVRFPSPPQLSQEDDRLHYLSIDPQHGQFLVSLSPLDAGPNNPYDKPDARRAAVADFARAMAVSSSQCEEKQGPQRVLIRCSFHSASKAQRGLIEWQYEPKQSYLLLNLAHESKFDSQTATDFLDSFLPETIVKAVLDNVKE